ncbi:MAG: CrcB family protein [Gemmatimonadaceae bacterium]
MLGSALGGGARFLVSAWVQGRTGLPFPVGTLVVNVTGSFLLGFLLELPVVGSAIGPQSQRFLTTGVCGGYTTFSTFSAEGAAMMRGSMWGRAGAYVTLSVVCSLAAVFAGAAVARAIFSARVRP